ncbi:MAG TPA: GNAT family N-acetyltransferase [Streptosporangiaceae bacterium]|jgi:GNAT superfamily N-acetyltransferase|nr:GNAT family N-acetyltransferase [Streptosporangiaceae bacterium]
MSEPEAVVDVIRAEEADAGVLSQLVADAFLDLPPSWWLIPDQAIRRRVFPDYFRIFVDAALADGIVQTTPDRSAVAIWLPSGHSAEPPPTADGRPSLPADDPPPADGPSPTHEPDDYLARLTAITQPWIDRFLAFDAAIENRHPHEPAHHHLAFLAVRPDRQGLGIGSALLQAHHQFLDTQNLPAYLEASHPRNRQLYLRHGYTDLGPPNYLPDAGPPMYPMWRDPKLP